MAGTATQYRPVTTYSLGTRLTAIMARRGLKPGVVADLMGLDRSTVAQWAADERPVNGRYLALLCEVLRCAPDDLVGERVVGSMRQSGVRRCTSCGHPLAD